MNCPFLQGKGLVLSSEGRFEFETEDFNEVSTRAKMLRAAKAEARRQHKKFKKVSHSRKQHILQAQRRRRKAWTEVCLSSESGDLRQAETSEFPSRR